MALIVFTPLRLYIPGYGDVNTTKELRELKIKTDSLEESMRQKDRYMENLKAVLQGGTIKLDTTSLNIPTPEKIND